MFSYTICFPKGVSLSVVGINKRRGEKLLAEG